MDRHVHSGRQEDLDLAIGVLAEAYELAEDDSPILPRCLNLLGGALSLRYERTGDLADLEQSIAAQRAGVQRALPQDRPLLLGSLGAELRRRYQHSQDENDLNEALAAFEEAVRLAPPDSPELAYHLGNLGASYAERFYQAADPGDLDRAVEQMRAAVAATQPGSGARAYALNNLGTALGTRYSASKEPKDLEDAVEAWSQACRLAPRDSTQLPAYLNNLGYGLALRYDLSRDAQARRAATRAYEQACKLGLEAAPAESLRSARNWGEWAARRKAWAEAARGYAYGSQAMDRLYRAQLSRRSKETWLRTAPRLSLQAAYALARCGELGEAVLALERGRTRLLSETLDRDRADLESLRAVSPDLYQRYCAAAGRIARLESAELSSQPGSWDARAAYAMRAARADLDQAVDRIRQVGGLAGFLAQPGLEVVQAAVLPGRPLVYLVTTPNGSLALIVRQTTHLVIEPVWIDSFTYEGTLWRGWMRAYARLQADERAWLDAMEVDLRQLWADLVGPLVAVLRAKGIQQVVLVPTGLLALLPLHAAWHVGWEGTRSYALDEMAISYAPSARAVAGARGLSAVWTTNRLLAVKDPDGSLFFAGQEVDAVRAHFPAAMVFRGTDARRDVVLYEAIPQCAVYHFACHGENDWDHPLRSGLRLADGRLTVQDLLAAPGEHRARLVFLSACESGLVGTQLPDEVVGLGMAFLEAGASAVVSTLWSVEDISTAILVERFYANWAGSPRMHCLQALREAQSWLRRATAQEMRLAERYRALFEAPGGQNRDAFLAMRYYASHPDEIPFWHPHYWAAFVLWGADV